MMTTTAGFRAITSSSKRAAITSLRCALTPWLITSQSGCACMSQYAYWLVASPLPFGGASRGDLNAGVPAVVESPIATIRTGDCEFSIAIIISTLAIISRLAPRYSRLAPLFVGQQAQDRRVVARTA